MHQQIRIELISKAKKDLMFIVEEGRALTIACVAALFIGGTMPSVAQEIHPLSSDNPRVTKTDLVVDDAVANFLSNSCHVGLSIAMVMGAHTKFYNYGSTSRDKQELPDADSVYEIASITKTFTGALAAQAVVEHRMKLDTDFRDYLPEAYPNLAWQGHPITLSSLATHRSGLPRDLPNTDDLYAHRDFERLAYQLVERESGYDRTRYLQELHTVHLSSLPGSKEVYSNLGLKVIGFGLERVYGVSFEKLIEQRILHPLGMRSTGFVVPHAEQAHLVQGYSRSAKPMPYHLRNAGAAYGLYSTTRDMAKYLHWQLEESDPVIRLAHQPLQGNVENGEALIWNLTLDGGTRLFWHGGGTFGMSSQVVLYPDDQEGFVLLSNDTCEGTESSLKNTAIAVHRALKAATK